MMNKLQLQVLKSEPAKIEFNVGEVSKYLDRVLSDYHDIIVSEENISDGKKMVAHLRKGKQALDDFRKETKKQLSEPIKSFENQCKELQEKFDVCIAPINEQLEKFENERKQAKERKVLEIISNVEKTKGVNGLKLKNEYLNKTMSLNKIWEELFKEADMILLEQSYIDKNKKLIKQRVESWNNLLNIDLIPELYYALIDSTEIEDISELIDSAAQGRQILNGAEFKKEIQESEKVEKFEEQYIVVGTNEQLDKLQEYFKNNNLEWRILD